MLQNSLEGHLLRLVNIEGSPIIFSGMAPVRLDPKNKYRSKTSQMQAISLQADSLLLFLMNLPENGCQL